MRREVAEKVLLNKLSGVLSILSIGHFHINAALCRLIHSVSMTCKLQGVGIVVFLEKE